MFSRSEKTEEVDDTMVEPSGERSPMVLAALAGLLAVAGAFLLVWYLNSGADDVASGTTTSPSGMTANSENDGATKQVLFATRAIPRGTSIRELRDAPTVYLTADVVAEGVVIPSAIESITDLRDEMLDGQVLAADVLPGEQLLRDRFRDPSVFDTDETFLEAATGVTVPANHHTVVLQLPASRAMGGNIRPGENVTLIGNFNVDAPDSGRYEISLVVLNSVEVIAIADDNQVEGALSNDIDTVGTASRGIFTITLAVEPDELTDVTYAIEYGDIILATAVEDFDNENDPRAITMINGIVGDDGVWLAELDDGNVFDLLSFLEEGVAVEGSSIEIEIEGDDDGAGAAVAASAGQEDDEGDQGEPEVPGES